ncbi:hypothetical protein WICMUC_002743 [Wickerhamomyces mucosus]|uniref:DUF4484 domain-containing protein n=1 Tax=Wickerhamomyces mucosus TaxID=1378264 RepID=A0A9P8TE47_9ASCO|nr:hypothetical protein WICMUC_002743 [Wickerhamomyces mucosus]
MSSLDNLHTSRDSPLAQKIITQQPSPYHLRQENSTQHSTLQSPVSGSLIFPISAIFLTQFNVKSGYELKWHKTIDESVNISGLEYKSLPSGLHEVEQDVVSFVQPKTNAEGTTETSYDLYYGISVYHQNLKESNNKDRSSVKMFSLGILVDPLRLTSMQTLSQKTNDDFSIWKPLHFTSTLQYVDKLKDLLMDWDMNSFTEFELFFDDYKRNDLLEAPIINSPRFKRTDVFPLMDNDTRRIVANPQKNGNHHYLLKLPKLLERLGPLTFRVWREALLRKRILLLDSSNVDLNDSFVYCLSIISTLPQDSISILTESGCEEIAKLRYIQPFYTVGVNDLEWFKLIKNKNLGYITFSTDEILLYKDSIYDYSISFKSDSATNNTPPRLLTSDASKVGAKETAPLRSTQRDLKRTQFLTKELGLYNNDKVSTDGNDHDDDNVQQWWRQVSDPVSWRQLIWTNFYWWASAGDKLIKGEETEGLDEIGIDDRDEVEKALFIVGYFQSMTKKLFQSTANIIINHDASIRNEGESLANNVITIEPIEVLELGLDPYSQDDANFLIQLIDFYWKREAKISSALNICCH